MTKKKTKIENVIVPSQLDYYAIKEFHRIKPLLQSCSYHEIDQPTLISYLVHFSNCERARRELKKNGIVLIDNRGVSQINPWHTVMRQNSELVKKLSSDLGFNTAARKRIGFSMQETDHDDGEEFFG